MTDVLRPVRVEVVSGTDADLVADRLRALDAAAPSPGLVTVCVVGAAGVAPLVLAAPGSPLAGSDVMLNWGHGVTRDALVDRLWGERIEPLARRLAGLTGPSPAGRHGQRFPLAANFSTAATLLLSTKDGPVRTAWPPPISLPLVLWSHRESTAR